MGRIATHSVLLLITSRPEFNPPWIGQPRPSASCPWFPARAARRSRPTMQSISTIGLDIAKSVFQVHGVDGTGQVVIRRQLKRRFVLSFFEKLSPCLVGIEACASSHFWSGERKALGHRVRLMPPAYVKPYGAPRRRVLPVEEGSTQRVVD